ncbi:isoprenoid synthase domain-containing protein [Aspergillus karnatakaensis]|uniref:isoprenoid synthase domain-containing protein n=1 Tax=Aspergillus karnatakaensis TaxID=1810916 RepID=UPI003CCCC513
MTAPPPTILQTTIHPLAPQLTQNVHAYLESNWSFSSKKYETAFFAMDFPRLLALICPEGDIERLESAAVFVCLTGLLDDTFSTLPLAESQKIANRLWTILEEGPTGKATGTGTGTGTDTKEESIPASAPEKVLLKLLSDMKSHDEGLAKEVMRGAIQLLEAQTSEERLEMKDLDLDQYFAFRFRDVGGEFFTALLRYTSNIPLPRSLREEFFHLVNAVIRHVILTNDIISWDKEAKEAREGEGESESESGRGGDKEGSAICSVVPILARNLGISVEGAKRVLWGAVRELEREIRLEGENMMKELANLNHGEEKWTAQEREAGERYIRALGFLASGNEEWSKTTSRYKVN